MSLVIIAATAPPRPSPPTYISSTSTTITIQIKSASDDGGAPVTKYTLYADDGNQNLDNFSVVQSYDG